MRRREFLTLAGGAAAWWPVEARAQQPARPVIGFLGSTDPVGYGPLVEALRQGLADLGYVEGRTIAFEYRWAMGRNDRLPALAAELVDRKVDLIVTHGPPASLALKRATATIPVVMAAIGDPVDFGLVASLARPGANFTGSSFFVRELNAKRLELLQEVKPGLARAGLLTNADNPAMTAAVMPVMRRMAGALRLELEMIGVRHPDELASALSQHRPRIDALVIPEDALFFSHAQRLAALTLDHALPAIGFREFCQAGGLVAYGIDFPHIWRKAAIFVDKILKGAKPGDLPVEQATKFELIINQKTANAFGLTIPESLHVRADAVIQ